MGKTLYQLELWLLLYKKEIRRSILQGVYKDMIKYMWKKVLLWYLTEGMYDQLIFPYLPFLFPCVSVSSGCITKCHRLRSLSTGIYFSPSGGWKSKIKAPAWSGEDTFLVHRHLTSQCVLTGWSEKALWGLFYKVINPIRKGFTLLT